MNWINAYHYTDGINDEAVVGPDILIQTDSLGLLPGALGFKFFPDLSTLYLSYLVCPKNFFTLLSLSASPIQYSTL